MAAEVFDNLTDVYEAMVDWPKRLANEGPFFRRLFDRFGVRSVADVACGTGQHAAMFHRWGLQVEGADLSPHMIDQARASFGQPEGLRWTVRGFDQPIPRAEPLDAAVCVGNSLALASDRGVAQQAVRQMLAAVRPGGAVVVQVLNLWSLADGPCAWQKCKRTTLPQGELLIVKGIHRCATNGYVDLLVLAMPGGALLRSESVRFLGLEAAELDSAARQAGATEVRFFGGYQDQPYVRQQSTDLLMIAEKGQPG